MEAGFTAGWLPVDAATESKKASKSSIGDEARAVSAAGAARGGLPNEATWDAGCGRDAAGADRSGREEDATGGGGGRGKAGAATGRDETDGWGGGAAPKLSLKGSKGSKAFDDALTVALAEAGATEKAPSRPPKSSSEGASGTRDVDTLREPKKLLGGGGWLSSSSSS